MQRLVFELVAFPFGGISRNVAADDVIAVMDQAPGETRDRQIPSCHEGLVSIHQVEHNIKRLIGAGDAVWSS